MTDGPLESALQELISMLEEFGEDDWAARLRADLRLVMRGDGYGLERLRQSFGGMGSLTDLVIHPVNGHRISEADVDGVNRQLWALVAKVGDRASDLARAEQRKR